MKSKYIFVISAAFAAIFAIACSFSTASLSDLTVSKDKDGKQAASTFKAGDTIYARATVSGSMSKHTVKYKVIADDVAGMKKGDTVKGSETAIVLESSGVAILTLPVPANIVGGKYTIVADMVDEKGEAKGSKSANITIEAGAAPAAPPAAADDKDVEDKKNDH